VIYGTQLASVVIPVSWGVNAAAEFGRHPQVALNDQIVDDCDICIALFANRLGTETPNAESGTAEEIERLHDRGRYVAILRSARPVNAAALDLDQAGRLNEYLKGLRDKALILEYADDAELQSHVDAILNTAVSRDSARAQLQRQESSPTAARVAEVWPRVDSEERTSTDSKGRLKSRRNWYLVLANTGDAPARNVTVDTGDSGSEEESWMIHGLDDGPIEVIAPRDEIRFTILATLGSAPQVRCTVRWTDDRGEQENVATLRLT
jgi:hypothetical protein